MEHALKRYRKAESLTSREFAAKVGVSYASISRIENGLQVPSLDLVKKVVSVTQGAVTANDFMDALPSRNRAL